MLLRQARGHWFESSIAHLLQFKLVAFRRKWLQINAFLRCGQIALRGVATRYGRLLHRILHRPYDAPHRVVDFGRLCEILLGNLKVVFRGDCP